MRDYDAEKWGKTIFRWMGYTIEYDARTRLYSYFKDTEPDLIIDSLEDLDDCYDAIEKRDDAKWE